MGFRGVKLTPTKPQIRTNSVICTLSEWLRSFNGWDTYANGLIVFETQLISAGRSVDSSMSFSTLVSRYLSHYHRVHTSLESFITIMILYYFELSHYW